MSEAGVVGLPMYDGVLPRSVSDAFYELLVSKIESKLLRMPVTVSRDISLHELWTHKDLLLAQTCGFPLVTKYQTDVKLVASPSYSCEGCGQNTYKSAIITRQNHPHIRHSIHLTTHPIVLAVNSFDSFSGWLMLLSSLQAIAHNASITISRILVTGSHMSSIQAVTSGAADIAAIDCVTLHLAAKNNLIDSSCLNILTYSKEAPTLPYITRKDTSDETLDALQYALRASVASGGAMAACISGFSTSTTLADYIRAVEEHRQLAVQVVDTDLYDLAKSCVSYTSVGGIPVCDY